MTDESNIPKDEVDTLREEIQSFLDTWRADQGILMSRTTKDLIVEVEGVLYPKEDATPAVSEKPDEMSKAEWIASIARDMESEIIVLKDKVRELSVTVKELERLGPRPKPATD